jgi:hypothetical protein
MWGRIFSVARGPLALVTIVAVGLTVLGATSVTLTIHNVGCGTMHAQSGMPFSIPGLSLPSEPIKSGGFAVAIVPPLSLSIDGTESGKLVMSSLGLHMSFQLGGSVKNVTLDGVSLLGKKSDVRLSEKDTHELSLICSS